MSNSSSSCLWLECNIVMNSETEIYLHCINFHLADMISEHITPFVCLWTSRQSCNYTFRRISKFKDYLIAHFSRDVLPVACLNVEAGSAKISEEEASENCSVFTHDRTTANLPFKYRCFDGFRKDGGEYRPTRLLNIYTTRNKIFLQNSVSKDYTTSRVLPSFVLAVDRTYCAAVPKELPNQFHGVIQLITRLQQAFFAPIAKNTIAAFQALSFPTPSAN